MTSSMRTASVVVFVALAALLSAAGAEMTIHPSLRSTLTNKPGQLNKEATVFYNDKSKTFSVEYATVKRADAAAWVWFDDTIETVGWATLNVRTNPALDDNVAMYAAGYAEGLLTQHRSYQYMHNMLRYFFAKPAGNETFTIPEPILKYMHETLTWTREQVSKNEKAGAPDAYWRQVGYVVRQWDGLMAGYQDAAPAEENIYNEAHLALSWFGDMLDLTQVLKAREGDSPDWLNMDHAAALLAAYKAGHCSALIKVTGDLSDMFFSHNSWFTYSALIRIVKTYDFPLNDPSTAAKRVVFSSYPLNIASLDDYYLTSAGLVVIETSNNIFDTKLYEKVKPASVLSWIRTVVSNRMATGGKSWSGIFERENSGTYNNQWMVADLNKFEPGVDIKPDTLWILEQIPGKCTSADLSRELQKGYWPSYNVPYFPDIFAASGYPAMVRAHGQGTSYGLAPRGSIFRRDAGGVETYADMKKLMRYNDFENDPYAHGDPWAAVSSRGDLNTPDKRSPDGGYDTKLSSFKKMYKFTEKDGWHLNELAITVQMGPTHDQQPVFKWESFPDHPRMGIPDVLKFDWVDFKEQRHEDLDGRLFAAGTPAPADSAATVV